MGNLASAARQIRDGAKEEDIVLETNNTKYVYI